MVMPVAAPSAKSVVLWPDVTRVVRPGVAPEGATKLADTPPSSSLDPARAPRPRPRHSVPIRASDASDAARSKPSVLWPSRCVRLGRRRLDPVWRAAGPRADRLASTKTAVVDALARITEDPRDHGSGCAVWARRRDDRSRPCVELSHVARNPYPRHPAGPLPIAMRPVKVVRSGGVRQQRRFARTVLAVSGPFGTGRRSARLAARGRTGRCIPTRVSSCQRAMPISRSQPGR